MPFLAFRRRAARGDRLGARASHVGRAAAATTSAMSCLGGRDRFGRAREELLRTARPRRPDPPAARPRGRARSRAPARREKRSPVRNSSRAADRPIFASTNGEITAGMMPEPDLGEPEHGVLVGDDDVADGGEPGAAAERGAMDAADHGHRQRVERREHARRRHRIVHVLRSRCSATVFAIQSTSRAGAEHLARAPRTTTRTRDRSATRRRPSRSAPRSAPR